MVYFLIIFLISFLVAFVMLSFRVWELNTGRKKIEEKEITIPHIPFRHIEKNMLYLTKHVVQGLVLVTVKYWFIFVIKARKWVTENWPKVHNLLHKDPKEKTSKPMSFTKRAVLESKFKIKKMKQKIRDELD